MQMRLCPLLVMLVVSGNLFAADVPVIQVEAQPLGGNITRLL